jgi:3-oxoacyl-[acyl-carrier-protein] synthase II
MPDMIRFLDEEKIPNDSTIHPLTFLQTPSDICVPLICKEHRLNTPPFVTVSACAASTDALGTAFRAVQEGIGPGCSPAGPTR